MTDHTPTRPRRFPTTPRTALLALALIGGGAAAGVVTTEVVRPQTTMAPATPVAIRGLSDGIVTVRGRAVELFGNKLVIQDATGRALIDLGREGEDGGLVGIGQLVTAQGRFEHGFVHAAFLVGADGKVHALEPLGGPHGRDHDGPRDRHGPPRGDFAPVPASAIEPSGAPLPPAAPAN